VALVLAFVFNCSWREALSLAISSVKIVISISGSSGSSSLTRTSSVS
jgi:hypothetical protein